MFKGLLIFIAIVFVVVCVFVLTAINIVLKLLNRIRSMASVEFDANKENERQSTARHKNQYSFRYNGKKARPGSSQYNNRSSEGETIIDNRRPDERNRKIISAEEGEYVEFTEET